MDRDLAPTVGCRSDYSGCDHPTTLQWGGETLLIQRIIKEWREPGSKHFLVETTQGSHFNLTYSEIDFHWQVSKARIKFK